MRNHDYDMMSRDRSSTGDTRNNWSERANRERSAFFTSDRDRNYPRHDYDYRSSRDRDLNRTYANSDSNRRDDNERFGRPTGERHGHSNLIASDRVEGTDVYGRDGNKLGTIHNFMVEKRGGKVEYAVMKCSDGFLGMDERYYPLEWSELDYDPGRDGYCVNMSERDLDDRRSFDSRGRPIRNERSSDYDRGGYGRSDW